MFQLFGAPFTTFVLIMWALAFGTYWLPKPWWWWTGILVSASFPAKYALAAWTADVEDEKEYKRQRTNIFYLWVTAAALVAGSLLGYFVYYEVLHQYFAVQTGEMYTNVVPTVVAAQHSDATIMVFEAEARVNTFQSGAYRRHRCDPLGPSFFDSLCWGSSLYCVAPVMGGVAQSEVQYWSIGEDCCTEEGGFACGVVEASTRAPKNCLVEVAPNEWFWRAVNQTIAKYRLTSSPDALFCRFVHDVDEDLAGQKF